MNRMKIARILGLLSGAAVVAALIASPVLSESTPAEKHEKKAEKTEKTAISKANAAKSLQIEDKVVGEGEEAKSGKTVVVDYTGTLYPEGKKFDSSLDAGKPFSFSLGAGQVIEGWEKGVKGMKVGGERTLIVPPQMAYGASGVPGAIPPNAVLKFDIKLLDVK